MKTLQDLYEAIRGALKPPIGIGTDLSAVTLGPVAIDSRDVVPGSVFWALPGKHHDGAEFAGEAFDHAAMGAVVERPVDSPEDCWTIEVKDVHQALWQWAGWRRRQFAGTVVAVAGEKQRTTAGRMIDTVLANRFRGAPSVRSEHPHEGLALAMLRIEPKHDYAVVEVDDGPRDEVRRMAELCRPQIAVITPAAREHPRGVAHRRTVEAGSAIAEAKGELLAALPADGVAVLGDDAALRRAAQKCRAPIIWVGHGAECDVTANDVQWSQGVLTFTLSGCLFRVPTWGEHQLVSALSAVAVGRSMGMDLEQIAEALACFESIPPRCRVVEIRGATIISDASRCDPGAMRAALELLRDFDTPGRRIVVCGEIGESGGDAALLDRQLGSQVATVCGADMLIACGENSGDVVAAARAAGMQSSRTIACRTEEDALPYLGQAIVPGDIVLLRSSQALTLERVEDALHRFPKRRAA